MKSVDISTGYFFLFLTIHICFSSLDKLRFLERIDDRIIELLDTPIKRNSELILDQIDLYNHCLYNVIEIMQQNTPDFIETCRTFLDTRGPACIQQPIDEDYLKSGYGWNDTKLYEFKLLFTETFNLWNLFLESFKRMKVDYNTYPVTEWPSHEEYPPAYFRRPFKGSKFEMDDS